MGCWAREPRELQDLPGYGGRCGEDLPDAAGGPRGRRGGARRGDRLPGAARPAGDDCPVPRAGARAAPAGPLPRDARARDGPARRAAAYTRALPDRRARAYEPTRARAREAL